MANQAGELSSNLVDHFKEFAHQWIGKEAHPFEVQDHGSQLRGGPPSYIQKPGKLTAVMAPRAFSDIIGGRQACATKLLRISKPFFLTELVSDAVTSNCQIASVLPDFRSGNAVFPSSSSTLTLSGYRIPLAEFIPWARSLGDRGL